MPTPNPRAATTIPLPYEGYEFTGRELRDAVTFGQRRGWRQAARDAGRDA